MDTLQSIRKTIEIADTWEKKGQPAWTIKSLSGAVMGYLKLAVAEFSTTDDAVSWLKENSADHLLVRERKTLEELIALVESKKLPPAVIGGNYPPMAHAHLAWAMGDIALGEFFANFSARPDVLSVSTPFWKEYATAVQSFMVFSPYRPSSMSLNGQEAYWYAYLQLIAAMTNREPLALHIENVDESFKKRNSDAKIEDDAYEIEGSPLHVARWDFRKAGLLAYGQTKN